MEFRTDRLGVLLDQLDASVDISRERLEGITDEEYLWEPTADSPSLRRREEARTERVSGGGEWVMEIAGERPVAPVPTIAFRVAHLYSGLIARWDWTFGTRSLDDDTLDYTPSAALALERLWEAVGRWRKGLETLTDEQMDMVGFGQYPHGLDPNVPFIAIVWWVNREFVHHMSEVALLRDLYALTRS